MQSDLFSERKFGSYFGSPSDRVMKFCSIKFIGVIHVDGVSMVFVYTTRKEGFEGAIYLMHNFLEEFSMLYLVS